VTVYDDFAHHPTAIETTLEGLRAKVGAARIIAVLEPRSNTMKMGVHRETIGPLIGRSRPDSGLLNSPDLGWDLAGAVSSMGDRASLAGNVEALVQGLAAQARAGRSLCW